MSRSWAKGSTRAWRSLRRAILASNALENHGRCQVGITDVCTGEATCVHHTRGKAYGDDPRWLVASCTACNLHVGQPGRKSPKPRPVSKW